MNTVHVDLPNRSRSRHSHIELVLFSGDQGLLGDGNSTLFWVVAPPYQVGAEI